MHFSPLLFVVVVSAAALFGAEADENAVERRSSDMHRQWGNGVGLWGKRADPEMAAIPDQGLMLTLLGITSGDVQPAQQKRAANWQQLNNAWGKRSPAVTNWETANNLWGKRSAANWETANNLWGKRSAATSNWEKANNLWGKRR